MSGDIEYDSADIQYDSSNSTDIEKSISMSYDDGKWVHYGEDSKGFIEFIIHPIKYNTISIIYKDKFKVHINFVVACSLVLGHGLSTPLISSTDFDIIIDSLILS